MTDLQAIADRVEIAALRGEHADAANIHDYDRLATLFTDDAVWRMSDVNMEFAGRDEIRAGLERIGQPWEFFVQHTHQGVIEIEGDTAWGRDYIFEIGRQHSGACMVNYGLFHDRYRRTPDGWKFTERSYEVQYVDTTPLAGGPQPKANDAADLLPVAE